MCLKGNGFCPWKPRCRNRAVVWQRLRNLEIVPDNVEIADSPEPIVLAGAAAVVLPAPLKRRHEARDLTEWFDQYESPTTPYVSA